MTIKQKAEALLTQYGWVSTTRNGVDCWIDSNERTTDAVYLGPSGSIRKGATKSNSIPLTMGLTSLERYLNFLQKQVVSENEAK